MKIIVVVTYLILVISFVVGIGVQNIFSEQGQKINTKEVGDDKDNISQYLDMARRSAKDLLETMRNTLLGELKKGDILSAISVCSDLSQNIIKEKQEKYRFYIRRVSEKFRNKKNKPDEYELSVLKKLEKLNKEGNLPEEYYEILEEKDGKYLRYFKPISVLPMCLACHGEYNTIPEDVKSFLKKKYPEDRAFGYKEGDFRGAVSIKLKISQQN